MPQFFVDKEVKAGESVELKGKSARHISQVLRLKAGDWLNVSDGKGRTFRSEILASAPTTVTVKILSVIEKKPSTPSPTLAISIIKPERFEWALEKCVELGTSKIIPLLTERTSSFRKDASPSKVERWRKISVEAAKQSGLPFLPEVLSPTSLEKLLTDTSIYEFIVLPFEGEDVEDVNTFWSRRKRTFKKPDLIIIGPEGGFTKEEVEFARSSGAKTISLGKQILRSETAAIAATSIWQYELGNMKI